MKKSFVLSYDLGTSGVKAALVTIHGEVTSARTVAYPLFTPENGWAEQDPADYWSGICHVTREILESIGNDCTCIKGIASGTQWKGIIPVDSQGCVLHRSIIWLDRRAKDQEAFLRKQFGEFSGLDYMAKLMWLKENKPEIIEKAALILDANSYLKWKLTGKTATDIGNCFVHSFDLELDQLYKKALKHAEISEDKFPKLVKSQELVGYVPEQAALQLGLKPGTPVFGGCNDIQAMAIGAGCPEIGGAHIYLGSSGWTGYTVPHLPGKLISSAFDEYRDVATFGMKATGLSVNWVVHRLYAEELQQTGDKVFELLEHDVAQIPAGSQGVLVTPWFYGDSPPLFGSDARGCFLNLGANHDRRHLARATLEGICYHLKMRAMDAQEKYGYQADDIYVTGGGTNNAVWMQMLADIMEKNIHVPHGASHIGARGIAYCALVGLGYCEDYSDAAKNIKIKQSYKPQPKCISVYRKNYNVFRHLYDILKPVFHEMNHKED